jgi:hypothetical protein
MYILLFFIMLLVYIFGLWICGLIAAWLEM